MTDQEINEAVARKLGWKEAGHLGWMSDSTKYKKPDDVICRKPGPPDYCHDIKAAWEIMLYVDKNGPDFNVGTNQNAWYVESNKKILCEAATAPMAICLAFLKLQ